MTKLAALSLITGLGAAVWWSVYMYRESQRHHFDHMRRTYVAHFPHELPHDAVLNFLRALSGLPTPGFLKPVHTVVFEVYADVNGITHFISIPGHVVADVESLFRTHIAGGSLVKADLEMPSWDEVAEFKTTSANKTLYIPSPEGVAATVLSGFSPLKADQAVLMQWVISPARIRQPTPEMKDKLSEPNFLAVVRFASLGPDADILIRHLYTSLASTHAHGMRFVRRRSPHNQVQDRIWQRSGMLVYPSTFNARELSVLLGFPFGGPNVPGLPHGRAKPLAPDHMIPAQGIMIGRSNFPGMEDRALALPSSALLMHQWILGPTGSGKSTLLHNEAASIMQAGHGLVVIEPKGDLALAILRSVPPSRIQDVIWFDPTDSRRPIGLNLLGGVEPGRAATHVVNLFKQLFGDSWGPRLEWIFKYVTLTAALNELTIVDAMQLLINLDFRREQLRKIKDPIVRQFWRDFDDGPDNAKQSVINKIDAFAGYGSMRNIVGQTEGLDMRKVVYDNKILLVPMSAVELEASGSLLGSVMVNQLWNQVRLRSKEIPADEREPMILMLDEFQHYLNLSVSIEELLAEARGPGLGLILANQNTKPLGDKVISGLLANARSKIMYAHGHEDADKMQKEFAPLTSRDLQTLGQYEVAAQLMTETGTAPVATARTAPPPRPITSGRALIDASREVYGRDFKDVENELARRHHGNGEERKKPVIGRVE